LEINSKVPDNEINTVDSRKIYDEFQRNKIIKVPFISNFKWENDFDSKEWEKVKLLNNFFLLGGTALPRLKTSVRLAYDKNNLFFAFRSDEKFRKYPLSSTGSIWNGDSIEIYILPDRGKMLQVIADAQGEQNLLIGSIKNTNIKLKLKKKSVPGKYWEIKLAIPFELIGDQPNNNWKINICRNRPPGNGVPMELSTWAPVLKKFNEPENFAKLVFEKNEDNSKIIIKNYGKGGKSSGEILKYILPQVLKWKPQLTVLMAGTNDMLNPGKFAGYNEFEKNMQQIIYRLKSNNGKIILLTIPPCIEKLLLQRHPNTAFKNESPSQKIIKANKIIKSLAKRNNIPVVDVYDIIKERGPLNDKFSLIRNETNSKSKDGVHPTAEGYRMIAKAVAEIVRKNNLPIRKIACLGDSITYGAHMKGAGTSEGDTYPGILSGLLK
jgi:lysophospholipase L1-like esterase